MKITGMRRLPRFAAVAVGAGVIGLVGGIGGIALGSGSNPPPRSPPAS